MADLLGGLLVLVVAGFIVYKVGMKIKEKMGK